MLGAILGGLGAGLGGLFSYFGSKNASRAQQEALREAMREQERIRQETIKHYHTEGEKLSKFLSEYSKPFYEDSKKLSSSLVEELGKHEQSRITPENFANHPMVWALNESLGRKMRPMLMKQGLWGSSAGNQMAADALHNNQLNTYSQLADIHNKTRDSIAGSRASALSQTQRLPETYASGVANFANTGMNAMGGFNANAARNMANFGQSSANAASQHHYDTANIFNNTVGNIAGIADRYRRDKEDKRYRDAFINYMNNKSVY